MVTFEVYNAKDLETSFKNAVDEYLQTCKTLHREPQKTLKGVFNVRVDSKLHQLAVKNATILGISLNAYIKNLIEFEVGAWLNTACKRKVSPLPKKLLTMVYH